MYVFGAFTMNLFCDKIYDEERAFYGVQNIAVERCKFDGPADGESAFKECSGLTVRVCLFKLRYPFWHDTDVSVYDSELTETCRAAFWYCNDVKIQNSKLHGIKALRECNNIHIYSCDIISTEFGWFCDGASFSSTFVSGEYFMLRSRNLTLSDVSLLGKYSFQYVENAIIENCRFDTKDAFWHAKNVIVRNSVIKGEYLGWYCENVTFENCVISGTQPLCYCKGLKLINCDMHGADLAFEKSEVNATILTPVLSIKNPKRGYISIPECGEIIRDTEESECEIEIKIHEYR